MAKKTVQSGKIRYNNLDTGVSRLFAAIAALKASLSVSRTLTKLCHHSFSPPWLIVPLSSAFIFLSIITSIQASNAFRGYRRFESSAFCIENIDQTGSPRFFSIPVDSAAFVRFHFSFYNNLDTGVSRLFAAIAALKAPLSVSRTLTKLGHHGFSPSQLILPLSSAFIFLSIITSIQAFHAFLRLSPL